MNGSATKSSRQPTETSLSKGKTIPKDISEEIDKEPQINERGNDDEHKTDDTNENDLMRNQAKSNDNEINKIKQEEEETVSPQKQTISPLPVAGASPPRRQPEVFTIEKFNRNMDEFVEVFASDKYTHVTDEYPVDDLVTVVSHVTTSVEEFKQQTVSSQHHLEELRETMRRVKEKIQSNIQRKSNIIRMGE